jgi:hypothetical protein
MCKLLVSTQTCSQGNRNFIPPTPIFLSIPLAPLLLYPSTSPFLSSCFPPSLHPLNPLLSSPTLPLPPVTPTSTGGATPLHRAAYAGHMDIIRLLLGNKADPRLTDSDGKTALHKVCMYWILTPRALKWDSVLYMAGIRRKTCWGCSTPVAARSRTEQH